MDNGILYNMKGLLSFKDPDNPTKLSHSSSLISKLASQKDRGAAQSPVPSFKRLEPGDSACTSHKARHVLETTFNADGTWVGAHYKAYIRFHKSIRVRVLQWEL